MDRVAMEAQLTMTTNMIEVCKSKTLQKSHGTDKLSEAEKLAF